MSMVSRSDWQHTKKHDIDPNRTNKTLALKNPELMLYVFYTENRLYPNIPELHALVLVASHQEQECSEVLKFYTARDIRW